MKYDGQIEELTRLPMMPGVDGSNTQKTTVAKKRVKGRKSAIVEEVESSTSAVSDESSKKSPGQVSWQVRVRHARLHRHGIIAMTEQATAIERDPVIGITST